ncbi:hypothetical protein Tco_1438849 [Tanacetum coccineum]
MAALQADLHATKGLIQAERYGGGGETAPPIPSSMRLDVPKFSGTDPDRWIFSINEYFTHLSTPVDQRLRFVGLNLEGDATEWIRWMTLNNLITTWDGFLESVRNVLGRASMKILKERSRIYCKKGRWRNIKATTGASGGGSQKRQSSRISVVVSQPAASTQSVKPLLLPTPTSGTSDATAKPLAIKWISPAERQERLSKGLCFNCDNPWVYGHKCPGKFMTGEEEDTKPVTEAIQEDALKGGDISILNSLVGYGSPRSLQL